MSRAVLVPFVGDPVTATFWMQFFINVWQDEVDKVYAYVGSNSVPVYILEYLSKLFTHPKIEFGVLPVTSHGEALTMLVNKCEEPFVMLMEEDAFVFKRGAISRNFELVEKGTYDFIGSPRDSVCEEVREAEYEKFGKHLANTPFDYGPNFWPNFVFTKKELLMLTDMHFDAKIWKKGDYIKELDHTMKEDGSGDTFTWVSIQIRSLTDKIGTVPQHKAYPIDPYLYRNREWTFTGKAEWVHAGSMSSGVFNYLRDYVGCPLFSEGTVHTFDVKTMDREDFIMRVTWWDMALRYSAPLLCEAGLTEFVDKYSRAIVQLKTLLNMTSRELAERNRIYSDLFGGKYVSTYVN